MRKYETPTSEKILVAIERNFVASEQDNYENPCDNCSRKMTSSCYSCIHYRK